MLRDGGHSRHRPSVDDRGSPSQEWLAAREKEGHVSERLPLVPSPNFRWFERGGGTPVILLHGLMGETDHWEATLEALGGVCRPIALELPIFDPALTDVSVRGLAEHVRRFMDALDLSAAIVGGNSLGGHVALELAIEWPHRVSGLILTGSSGLFERTLTRGVPHRPTAEYVRERMEEIFYDPVLVTPAWVESVRRMVTTRRLAQRLLQVARAAKRDNVEGRLHEIQAATIIVWGEDDRITPPPMAERFHALITSSELVFLPRCGHAPMLEQPDAFNAVIERWLGEGREAIEPLLPAARDRR
jgi:2-hydroxy-6-oxonona-2,4-dienedioate hydrolase